MGNYETVIGLELHAQLKTRSKLFCGCSTAFGTPPNSQTCPVCLGLPGALPVLNRQAFEYGLRTALALHCTVRPTTAFDRKNYCYPDLPKNYQISQNHQNLGEGGYVDIDVDGAVKRIRIANVHLEEDAGKLMHPEGSGARTSQVDLNRTGTPLVEIVTEPDMRSVEEARAYMETMRQILSTLGVSDCRMEEGSLRFEASISLRPLGQERLGNRVEIKNVNSVRFVVEALECEIRRQSQALDCGRVVAQETVLYDERSRETRPMRSKEYAQDYRYFPDPDLVPVELTEAELERVRASIPELPLARRLRLTEQYGIPAYDAGVLVEDSAVADYFEACAGLHRDGKAASNLVMNEVLRELKERGMRIQEFPVSPGCAAELLDRVVAGEVSRGMARDLFGEMIRTGRSAGDIIKERGLRQIGDADTVREAVERCLRENAQAVADYRAGRKKARGALVGAVMRATKGQADPALVNRLLDEMLAEAP